MQETWPTSPESDGHEYEVYVCDDCGEEISPELADPVEDRADALADAQIDLYLEERAQNEQ